MGRTVMSLLVVVIIPSIVIASIEQRAIRKRSIAEDSPADFDYPHYPANNNEYPVVVPKRAALLLDQLVKALQKAVDNQVEKGRGDIGSSRTLTRSAPPNPVANSQMIPSDEQTMDLKRRGQAKGRLFWRCYFNAVTCYKRK